jgi:S-adenosylmethionine synthetase
MGFAISFDGSPLPGERRIEIVERKGLGHPDSICDAVAEELSLALSRFYLEQTGRVLHHNVDKALLAAGVAAPRFGGGTVVEPMQVFLAGRATLSIDGAGVPIEALAEGVTRDWFRRHLRAVDPAQHVQVSSLVRPGSTELVELFGEVERTQRVLANDTSCGVGYAPLSELERMVLAVEQQLNSSESHAAEPAFGEDVKVMGVRDGDEVELTVAVAMIDGALQDLTEYSKATQAAAELALEAARRASPLSTSVKVNAGDDLASDRVYLTVTGTSAEAGDDGQAGRGNRANGLITPGRTMTIESVAGKNPVTHVGKLYNITASLAAERLVSSLADVQGAECRLVSRIGWPIEEPQLVEVRLAGVSPERGAELRGQVEQIMREELQRLPRLAEQLVQGELRLNRWPLHG